MQSNVGVGSVARVAHSPGTAVHLQRTDANHIRGDPTVTAQQGGDPRHQFTDSEGLGDVVVGPEIQAPDHLGFFAQSRQHDHGYLKTVGTDPATNLMTRQTRQHEIQQHQIGAQGPRQF